MNQQNNKWWLVFAGIVVAVIVGFAIGNRGGLLGGREGGLGSENSGLAPAGYTVVYLQTGEMYVGKLSFTPKMHLDDVYLMQSVRDQKDPTGASLQLVPAKNFAWAPATIYLNPQEVVFYGEVGSGSRIDQGLKQAAGH